METKTLLTDREKNKLVELSKDKIVLEIGTYHGGSAKAMVDAGAKQVITIDSRLPANDLNEQIENISISLTNLRGKAIMITGYSHEVIKLLKKESVDMVFIDGSHEYVDVKQDYFNVLDIVKSDGIICFHDYEDVWPGVKYFIDSEFKDLKDKMEFVDSLAVIKLGV